jgi:hypothetical protein
MDSDTRAITSSGLRKLVRRFFNIRSRRLGSNIDLFNILRESGVEAYIFGGAIRDIAIMGPYVRPRDLDVVVSGYSGEALERLLEQWIVRRTRFGGFHVRVGHEAFDIWASDDSWAIREFPLFASSPSDLPTTTPFTLEAVVVTAYATTHAGREIWERGFFDALNRRVIELNFEPHQCSSLTFVRAISLAHKTGFGIGPRLASYMARVAAITSPDDLAAQASSHYGSSAPSDVWAHWCNEVKGASVHGEVMNVASRFRHPNLFA